MHVLQPDDPFTLDTSTEPHIIPFGGCGEFGMNLTAYIFKNELYVVDCGIMFPDQGKLGIDAIVPDLRPWFEKFGAPKAYVITHGHEDHIGALPIVHDVWPAPIYATGWTAELIKNRFDKYNLKAPTIHVVKPGDKVSAGVLSATYLAVNHSIPMTCSLLIEMGGKKIWHTGDFKFDADNPYEPAADLEHFAKLCSTGTDAVVVDSTNATSPGRSQSESTVIDPLQDACNLSTGTVFLTTFSSNWWRLQTIFTIAGRLGKKVLILGAGLKRTVDVARDLGLLDETSTSFVEESEVGHIPRHKLLVLLSGCQGEPRSALGRIVRDEIRSIRLQKGDRIIFSSRVIPGSERSVYHVSALCAHKGVEVLTSRSHPGIHVSGHAYQDDIRALIKAVKPKHFIPVHGTFTQLMANQEIATGEGIPPDKCLVPEDGCVFALRQNGAIEELLRFEIEWSFIDGYSKQQLDRRTLKQRLKIGEMGLAVISGVFDYTKGDWQQKPTIDLRGLGAPETKYWQAEAQEAVRVAIAAGIRRGIVDQEGLAEVARLALRRHFQGIFKKKIVVVAHIHPV